LRIETRGNTRKSRRITDGAAVYDSFKREGFSNVSCHEGNSLMEQFEEFRRRNDFLAPSDNTFSIPISTEGDLFSLGEVDERNGFIGFSRFRPPL
jgi:hypothetical protein